MLFPDPGPLREAAEQICLVWDLVVALWGKLKEDGDVDEEGKTAVFCCVLLHLNLKYKLKRCCNGQD